MMIWGSMTGATPLQIMVVSMVVAHVVVVVVVMPDYLMVVLVLEPQMRKRRNGNDDHQIRTHPIGPPCSSSSCPWKDLLPWLMVVVDSHGGWR